MKDLTLEQLEAQKEAINTTRFLMQNDYNGSDTLIDELMVVFKAIDDEIYDRTK